MKAHLYHVAVIFGLFTVATHAQVPQMLHYQGRVTDAGTNITGTIQFKFALVGAPTNLAVQATAYVDEKDIGPNGEILAIRVLNPGAGYTSAPNVRIRDREGGSGARAMAIVSGGRVTSIIVVDGGTGYVAPRVDIDPPPDNWVSPTYWSNDGTSTNGSQPVAAVSIAVNKGLYSVLLGDPSLANMTAIPITVFTNADVRLRVWCDDGAGGWQQLSPDQRIAAVGYAIMAAAVANGSITTESIVDGAITPSKIAPGAIGTAQLADWAVTAGKLGPGAVTAVAIADAAVGVDQLADGAVTTGKLAPRAVTTVAIANNAVGPMQIADQAVTAGKLAPSAVTAEAIADGAVTAGCLAAGAVTAGKLAPGAVTTGAIASNAVGTAQIAPGAVDNTKLANSTITITAGPGLTGGGSVPLGASVTVSANLNHDETLVGNGGSSQLRLNLANTNTWTALQTFRAGLVVVGDLQGERLNVGTDNTLGGAYSTIAGGTLNVAGTNFATVGGGLANHADGLFAVVSGGTQNGASGECAIVAGGLANTASGAGSFAAGKQAVAYHDGAFVWSSGGSTTFSWGTNTFTVRCQGGARFYTASGTGTGVQLASGAGSWSSLSDRETKTNFVPVEPRAVLAALMRVPICTWNYKTQDPKIRHIGPVAQDFYTAFGVGEDERHISTIDADGVALAAIQGLYALVQEKDAAIVELREQNDKLERRLAELERRVNGGGKQR